MALSAYEHFRAFRDAFADVFLDSLALLLAHHRPDRRLRVGRITHWEGENGIQDCLLDFVEPAPRHEEPGACDAGLAAVQKSDDKGCRDCLFEIGVVQEDVGRLAAQL
jgi:hypothetical protein